MTATHDFSFPTPSADMICDSLTHQRDKLRTELATVEAAIDALNGKRDRKSGPIRTLVEQNIYQRDTAHGPVFEVKYRHQDGTQRRWKCLSLQEARGVRYQLALSGNITGLFDQSS